MFARSRTPPRPSTRCALGHLAWAGLFGRRMLSDKMLDQITGRVMG
ncbi:hypothetical protein LTH96_12825 [Nesterenkonia sp. LB17]|nr:MULTISPECIES: hypothetical protein [unclassified Nesterenkonia]MCH8563379.1 hypothetical protein [Nesterenkonia sp. YGD6]MCH8566598.1 hypothetical protein [Nesterenkonia sp. LB17]